MASNQISNHGTLYCQSKVRSSIPHAFAFAYLEGIQLFSQGIIQHSLVHEITSLELQHQKRHCQIWVGKSASRERQHVIEKSKGRRRLEIWTDLAANLKRVKCRMTVQDIYESFFFFLGGRHFQATELFMIWQDFFFSTIINLKSKCKTIWKRRVYCLWIHSISTTVVLLSHLIILVLRMGWVFFNIQTIF